MGTGSFLGGKKRPRRDADPSPLIVPWSRKSRAISLPPYGPYGLYRVLVLVQGCNLYVSNIVGLHLHRCKWCIFLCGQVVIFESLDAIMLNP